MKKKSIKIKVLLLSILIIVSACKEQNSIEQNEDNKVTEKIIRCSMEVHRQLGPGLLESVYQKCLAFNL